MQAIKTAVRMQGRLIQVKLVATLAGWGSGGAGII